MQWEQEPCVGGGNVAGQVRFIFKTWGLCARGGAEEGVVYKRHDIKIGFKGQNIDDLKACIL